MYVCIHMYIIFRRVKTLFSTSFRGEIHDEHRRNVRELLEVHFVAINVNGLDAVQHIGLKIGGVTNSGGSTRCASQCRCRNDNTAPSHLRRCCRRAPGKEAARQSGRDWSSVLHNKTGSVLDEIISFLYDFSLFLTSYKINRNDDGPKFRGNGGALE